jgi:hypothetical protein
MSGWAIGFTLGAAVVLVVVVLLATMIFLARRIDAKAQAIVTGLHTARDHTAGLWNVADTNVAASRIVDAAKGLGDTLSDGRVAR